MRRTLFLSVLFVLILTIVMTGFGVGCTSPAPSPKPAAPAPAPAPKPTPQQVYELIYSDGFPRGQSIFEAAVREWVKPLEVKSNGRLKFKVYGSGELVPGGNLFETLTKGGADCGQDGWVWHAGTFPEASVTWLPYLFDTASQLADCFYQVQLPIFNRILREKYNQMGLLLPIPIAETLFTRKPVQKMEDLKGFKIRAMGGASSVFYDQLGAAGVTIPLPETLPGLATGALDGVLWYDDVHADMKAETMASYAIMQPIMWGNPQISFNLNSWNKLPPDLQQLILDHSRSLHYRGAAVLGPKRGDEYKKILMQRGVKYYTLPDDEFKRWQAAAVKVWEWFVKQSPTCKELMDATIAYLDRKW